METVKITRNRKTLVIGVNDSLRPDSNYNYALYRYMTEVAYKAITGYFKQESLITGQAYDKWGISWKLTETIHNLLEYKFYNTEEEEVKNINELKKMVYEFQEFIDSKGTIGLFSMDSLINRICHHITKYLMEKQGVDTQSEEYYSIENLNKSREIQKQVGKIIWGILVVE